MNKKLITGLLVAVLLINVPSVFAEDPIIEKLDQLKETIRSHVQGAPRPGFMQKVRIRRTVLAHVPSLRKDFMELRSTIISMKREARQHLTRDQLLTLLDKKDEFSMLPPGLRIAKGLKQLDPQDRVQLVTLARELWRGDKADIAQNVRNLRDFVQSNIHPYVVRELSLTAEQEAAWQQIIAANDEKIEKLVIKIVFKLSHVRDEILDILSDDQKAFIEANRDKIFQEVLNFIENL